MSRVNRPQAPGTAFHITARTQGKQPWFEEKIRSTIERHIVEGVTSSDAMLMARVVMPNHFHIVLRQGTRPLGWIMQPIMRRIALLVQRAVGVEGHVFERRFRSVACENADHLRRAIIYTHLNPRRAGLCTDDSYEWTSARSYAANASSGASCDVAIALALRLFAASPDDSIDQLWAYYQRYLQWRLEKDAHDRAGTLCYVPEPVLSAGDAHFLRSFCSLPVPSGRPTKDLRDKAIELLPNIDPVVTLDSLRRKSVKRSISVVRSQLIASLLQARYTGRCIADFFRISDSAVSKIASRMRYAQIQT
jgi:putative transposase